MAQRLYLIDGMSHIYRAFHAIQGLSSKSGFPTNAVYGFTNMVRKLIAEEKPDYLAVALDLPGPTVRHEEYAEYKATRKPMPEDLSVQMPHILRVCEALRIPVLSLKGYEADDVIGTLAREAARRGLEIVIVTIDKDMFQLVTDRVTILDTRNMARLDPRGVEEKFGAPPERVVDVLSLVGDSSDNIPGAPGIGAKGARQLIEKFGDLDTLLERRGEVSRKSYRESLEQNQEQILQSRELVRIRNDLPVEMELEELRLSGPDVDSARELFAELNFTSMLGEFLPAADQTATDCRRIDRAADLAALRESVAGKRAALVLQYPENDYLEGELEALAIATGAGRAWLVPARLADAGNLDPLLAAAAGWVVHDLKPLRLFATRLGWKLPAPVVDAMLAAYLVDPNQKDFSLQKLSLEILQRRLDGTEEEGLFEGDSTALCQRADAILALVERLESELDEKQLRPLLEEVETPLVEVLAEMERAGVRVDSAQLERMSSDMESEIEDLQARIHEIAGGEFNLNSPRQLAAVLYEKLNLPVIRKTRKAGHYATGVEVLEELAASYEIARVILDYRELTKLKNTYLDALPRLVNPRTGRIHTSYNQMVAATGRLSSSNPNLQNIPVKSELGRRIRRAFVPGQGHLILAADYSQIELRVMAHLSEDPVLIDAFLKGEDIHERTAREVFGLRAEMEPRECRRHAKVINFGIMYGLSAFGLARSLKIERREAQEFIDDYFARYGGVKRWIDRTLEEAYRCGYVTTLFGRIRPIPELKSRDRNRRSFGERTAINAPIQGTAADLIKVAMVSLHSRLKERKLQSRLIMQVHDELVFEVAGGERETLEELVRREMESVAELKVPLRVDVGVGESWYDAK